MARQRPRRMSTLALRRMIRELDLSERENALLDALVAERWYAQQLANLPLKWKRDVTCSPGSVLGGVTCVGDCVKELAAVAGLRPEATLRREDGVWTGSYWWPRKRKKRKFKRDKWLV